MRSLRPVHLYFVLPAFLLIAPLSAQQGTPPGQPRDERYAVAADTVAHFDDVGPAPPSTTRVKRNSVDDEDDGFDV